MKNDTIVIYNDPLLGSISLQDLIYYLNSLICENLENLNILENILKHSELDNEDIVSILNKFDMENNIKFIRDILSDYL